MNQVCPKQQRKLIYVETTADETVVKGQGFHEVRDWVYKNKEEGVMKEQKDANVRT